MPRLNVFLSYATEDAALVTDFYEAFSTLNRYSQSNIDIFYDREVISGGSPLSETIEKSLDVTDYLVIFLTGVSKPSHGYTGIEVGYFKSIMRNVAKKKIERKIVPIFLDGLPGQYADLEGYDIGLPADEVSLEIDDFIKICTDGRSQSSQLASGLEQFFNAIGALAEGRYWQQNPVSINERNNAQQARFEAVSKVIIPALMRQLYKWSRRRITTTRIEQYFIEFEFPDVEAVRNGITGEVFITPHAKAFEIFGIGSDEKRITWEDFSSTIRETYEEEAEGILSSIERSLLSSVLPDKEIDNEQIFRSPVDSDKIYRMIVTRRYVYHDGRVVVHMYIVDLLRLIYTSDSETTIILTFINASVKFKSLFLSYGAYFSLQKWAEISAKLNYDSQDARRYISRFMEQLTIVEGEANVFRLDNLAHLKVAIGKLEDKELSFNNEGWISRRSSLQSAADAALVEKDPSKFVAAAMEWGKAQADFLKFAKTLNQQLTNKALDRLKVVFEG